MPVTRCNGTMQRSGGIYGNQHRLVSLLERVCLHAVGERSAARAGLN